MGAGASIPETLTKDQAKDLAGDKWDEAAFDAVATEGTITAAQLTATAAPAEGEKKPPKQTRKPGCSVLFEVVVNF
jgi:hypothetical protein